MKKSTIAAVIVSLFAGNVSAEYFSGTPSVVISGSVNRYLVSENSPYTLLDIQNAMIGRNEAVLEDVFNNGYLLMNDGKGTFAINQIPSNQLCTSSSQAWCNGIQVTASSNINLDKVVNDVATTSVKVNLNTLAIEDKADVSYVDAADANLQKQITATSTSLASLRTTVTTNGNTLNSVSGVANSAYNKSVLTSTELSKVKSDLEGADINLQNEINTKASKESLEYLDGKVVEIDGKATAAMVNASTALTTANTAKHNTEQLARDKADRSEVAGMNDDIRHNTNRINGLESKVADFGEQLKAQAEEIVANDKKAMAGIASAMAMSAMNYTNTTHSMAFATGKYDSGSAIGIGYKYQMGSAAQASIQATVDSNKNTGVSAGVAFGW